MRGHEQLGYGTNTLCTGRVVLPRLIGLVCALVALSASILGNAETWTSLLRAAVAFAIGSILTQVWYALFAVRITTLSVEKNEKSFQNEEKERTIEGENKKAA